MFKYSLLTDLLGNNAAEETVKADLIASLSNFNNNVYSKRPFASNQGGMGIESSFFLWMIVRTLQPKVIVESGVWKGFTTFIFENEGATEEIFCFDPVVNTNGFIQYKSSKATYFDTDWATPHFSFIDTSNALAFFDDHQDQLERLAISQCRGYKYVVFDDNYFFGGGGHSGLVDYMRNRPELLDNLVEEILIAPPLIFQGKGIDPIFSINELERLPGIVLTITSENNYNWLTLVKLKPPIAKAHSQIPNRDYIIKNFARLL